MKRTRRIVTAVGAGVTSLGLFWSSPAGACVAAVRCDSATIVKSDLVEVVSEEVGFRRPGDDRGLPSFGGIAGPPPPPPPIRDWLEGGLGDPSGWISLPSFGGIAGPPPPPPPIRELFEMKRLR